MRTSAFISDQIRGALFKIVLVNYIHSDFAPGLLVNGDELANNIHKESYFISLFPLWGSFSRA